MRQIAENLYSYSFQARRIMFLGILHFLCSYYNSRYYRRLLLQFYKNSISSAIQTLHTSTSFSYHTISIATAYVLIFLRSIFQPPPIHYTGLLKIVFQSKNEHPCIVSLRPTSTLGKFLTANCLFSSYAVSTTLFTQKTGLHYVATSIDVCIINS